jgi:hypothetical protein
MYATENYNWMFYPPPYNFVTGATGPDTGGGCGCGGTCGGCGGGHHSHGHGMGLFDSGMDYTQWGWQEWAAVAAGAYVVLKLVGDTKRATRATRAGYRAARKAL